MRWNKGKCCLACYYWWAKQLNRVSASSSLSVYRGFINSWWISARKATGYRQQTEAAKEKRDSPAWFETAFRRQSAIGFPSESVSFCLCVPLILSGLCENYDIKKSSHLICLKQYLAIFVIAPILLRWLPAPNSKSLHKCYQAQQRLLCADPNQTELDSWSTSGGRRSFNRSIGPFESLALWRHTFERSTMKQREHTAPVQQNSIDQQQQQLSRVLHFSCLLTLIMPSEGLLRRDRWSSSARCVAVVELASNKCLETFAATRLITLDSRIRPSWVGEMVLNK